MKLLLTSAGISNETIAKALFSLVGKNPEDTSVIFIPTASNSVKGDKGWFIDDLMNLQKRGFKSIGITDISAVGEKIWRPQIEEADVVFFEGGDTYHLMNWINASGLVKILPKLLSDKVYVGVSAGSVVASKDLSLEISQIIYGEDLDKSEEMVGLNYVDFYFLPHLNSPYFENVREDSIRKATSGMSEKIYALDDDGALSVVDGTVEIVSEGICLEIN